MTTTLVVTEDGTREATSAREWTILQDVLNGGLPASPARRRRRPDDSDDLRLGRVLRYEDRRI